ncbi:MAG TPA: DUF2071 domain-containing protein [Pyrinomonadaceae bacterium]|nr:DUF2071 domain-containing protein [Pyrinomonadaceae bacterium]
MEIDRLSIRERPEGFPLMHQSWGKLLFMHWPIDASILRSQIPKQLEIDTFDGSAWIGVIPFTMWGIRASFLPAIPGTDAFHELNVRTYVHLNGVPGVWFFSLDAANSMAVWAARQFYHLPYFNAEMSLEQNAETISYSSVRQDDNGPTADFAATWSIGNHLPTADPESLEFFLTERYCLYSENEGQLYRALIHHQPWPLQEASVSQFASTMTESLGVKTPQEKARLLYAEAIDVEIWPLKKV